MAATKPAIMPQKRALRIPVRFIGKKTRKTVQALSIPARDSETMMVPVIRTTLVQAAIRCHRLPERVRMRLKGKEKASAEDSPAGLSKLPHIGKVVAGK